jgi:hypothetical protein
MSTDIQSDASASNDAQGNDEPQSPVFSPAQLRELNKIQTSYSKKLERSLDSKFSGIQSVLSSLANPQGPVTSDEVQERPTLKKVDTKTAELEKQVQILLERDRKREDELRQERLDKSLSDALLSVGVAPELLKPAKAYVRSERLKQDEEGSTKFRHEDIDYDLADGLKLWAKSDDAKWALAAKTPKGTGQTRALRPVNPSLADANLSPTDKAAKLKADILARNQVGNP